MICLVVILVIIFGWFDWFRIWWMVCFVDFVFVIWRFGLMLVMFWVVGAGLLALGIVVFRLLVILVMVGVKVV